jgi:hypothetical protein
LPTLVRERSTLAAPFVRSSHPEADRSSSSAAAWARQALSCGEHLGTGDRLASLGGSGRRDDCELDGHCAD